MQPIKVLQQQFPKVSLLETSLTCSNKPRVSLSKMGRWNKNRVYNHTAAATGLDFDALLVTFAAGAGAAAASSSSASFNKYPTFACYRMLIHTALQLSVRDTTCYSTWQRWYSLFTTSTYSVLDTTSVKGTMDPEGSACNSCNSWPSYAHWAEQRACFG